MPPPDPTRHNRDGREIWFKDVGEGYGPAHRKGCILYLLCSLWILVSAGVGFLLFALGHAIAAAVVPLLLVTPALLLFATVLRRHS